MENQNEGLPMIKEISRAVLVCGILLLILGVNVYDSSSFGISQFFSGSPDKTTWMLAGGAVAVVLGLVGLLGRSKTA